MSKPKGLYAEMGDETRERQLDKWRKKFSTGNAELDKASAIQDEAAEGAHMPDAGILAGMKGVNADADKWAEENKAALAALEEDEEDKKWMAKQRG